MMKWILMNLFRGLNKIFSLKKMAHWRARALQIQQLNNISFSEANKLALQEFERGLQWILLKKISTYLPEIKLLNVGGDDFGALINRVWQMSHRSELFFHDPNLYTKDGYFVGWRALAYCVFDNIHEVEFIKGV